MNGIKSADRYLPAEADVHYAPQLNDTFGDKMNIFSDIFWMAGQAFSGLFVEGWNTLAVAVIFLLGLIWDITRKKLSLDLRLLFLFLPLIGTFVILLTGAIFKEQPGLKFLPYLGFGVCVLLCGISAYKLRPAWCATVGASLFILWYSVWCGFVSMMSITNDWL
ncbi:MAG: hypothetical protein JXA73_17425 [Acidobacteria bacterium]|nr:hypothetical protein [Acidobacteriota bacterium]